MMFPVSELLDYKMSTGEQSPRSSVPRVCQQVSVRAQIFVPELMQNLVRLALVSVTGAVVVAIPSFANLMALIGSTCCMLLAFILPAWFHYRLLGGRQVAMDVLFALVGVFGCACAPHARQSCLRCSAVLGTIDVVARMTTTSEHISVNSTASFSTKVL
jgi:hypothetical protein